MRELGAMDEGNKKALIFGAVFVGVLWWLMKPAKAAEAPALPDTASGGGTGTDTGTGSGGGGDTGSTGTGSGGSTTTTDTTTTQTTPTAPTAPVSDGRKTSAPTTGGQARRPGAGPQAPKARPQEQDLLQRKLDQAAVMRRRAAEEQLARTRRGASRPAPRGMKDKSVSEQQRDAQARTKNIADAQAADRRAEGNTPLRPSSPSVANQAAAAKMAPQLNLPTVGSSRGIQRVLPTYRVPVAPRRPPGR